MKFNPDKNYLSVKLHFIYCTIVLFGFLNKKIINSSLKTILIVERLKYQPSLCGNDTFKLTFDTTSKCNRCRGLVFRYFKLFCCKYQKEKNVPLNFGHFESISHIYDNSFGTRPSYNS